MKLMSIFIKSLKEQIRSFWVLLLTISMGPFFIFVYFLIMEASKVQYDILILNRDPGMNINRENNNYFSGFIEYFAQTIQDTSVVPIQIREINSREEGIDLLQERKADALIILPGNFFDYSMNDSSVVAEVEFIGDLTNVNYLVSAIWANAVLTQYALERYQVNLPLQVTETGLGTSASVDDFDMATPGLLIFSIIMLMFTASIAFVVEVENKTIIRLKLSRMKTIEFLFGISLVQILVGLFSMMLTLTVAISLGFDYKGSLWLLFLLAFLTSLSIIAFSLIIAGLTKSANEILVVGNFPLFLFMFFTGAAFPIGNEGYFYLWGYPVNLQGLMSPTHSIWALNKVLILGMTFQDIIPELIAILFLTLVYFTTGVLLFRRNHMKLV